MTQGPVRLNEEQLWAASNEVQNFLISITPHPADSFGISAMVFVNFLSAGIACGAFEMKDFDELMLSVRENLDKTVEVIMEEMAENSAFETIQ
jgi:hypothetical protein